MNPTKLEIVGQGHFTVGRHQLHKHWGLDEWRVSSLLRPGFAKQLCLKGPSEFPSGRVPLYVCRCGDLECGAVTVSVSEEDGLILWEEFGNESPSSPERSASDYMANTGPLYFERDAYLYALSPFL